MGISSSRALKSLTKNKNWLNKKSSGFYQFLGHFGCNSQPEAYALKVTWQLCEARLPSKPPSGLFLAQLPPHPWLPPCYVQCPGEGCNLCSSVLHFHPWVQHQTPTRSPAHLQLQERKRHHPDEQLSRRYCCAHMEADNNLIESYRQRLFFCFLSKRQCYPLKPNVYKPWDVWRNKSRKSCYTAQTAKLTYFKALLKLFQRTESHGLVQNWDKRSPARATMSCTREQDYQLNTYPGKHWMHNIPPEPQAPDEKGCSRQLYLITHCYLQVAWNSLQKKDGWILSSIHSLQQEPKIPIK